MAEEGHNGGRAPGVSRQGLYAATAGGRFLASINTRSPERMVAMLQEARERWDALPEEERRATRDAGGERPEDRYPEGGLALVVHMRDLPREDLPDDWRAEARNLDRAWFQREELPGLLPPEPGRRRSEGPVDPALVQRLARLHLVDNVRGQAPLFRPERVVKAELTVRVVRTPQGACAPRVHGPRAAGGGGALGRRAPRPAQGRGRSAARLRGRAAGRGRLEPGRAALRELRAGRSGSALGSHPVQWPLRRRGARGDGRPVLPRSRGGSPRPCLPLGLSRAAPRRAVPLTIPETAPASMPAPTGHLSPRRAALRGLQAVAAVTATYGGAHLASRLDLLCGT